MIRCLSLLVVLFSISQLASGLKKGECEVCVSVMNRYVEVYVGLLSKDIYVPMEVLARMIALPYETKNLRPV